LSECDLTSSRLENLPPLFLYDEKREYTPEMKKIFAGEGRVSNL
jgi:tRNA1(Val) A37 N6-methylase TrmN6